MAGQARGPGLSAHVHAGLVNGRHTLLPKAVSHEAAEDQTCSLLPALGQHCLPPREERHGQPCFQLPAPLLGRISVRYPTKQSSEGHGFTTSRPGCEKAARAVSSMLAAKRFLETYSRGAYILYILTNTTLFPKLQFKPQHVPLGLPKLTTLTPFFQLHSLIYKLP